MGKKMSEQNDVSNAFADLLASASYEDLPTRAIEKAKKSILDTLGVILAASGVEPRVRALADLVHESGGHPQSSVFGFGERARGRSRLSQRSHGPLLGFR